MSIFGALERFLSETAYPYRVPLTVAAVTLLVALVVVMARSGLVARIARAARRRPLPATVGAFLVLSAAGVGGNYLLSPLWTRASLNEALPVAADASPSSSGATRESTTKVIRQGEWRGADDFHFARGTARVIEVAPGEHVLRVEHFSVRNGPDLFVILSPRADGYADGGVNLGRLKATDGAFNYAIPAGTDLSAVKSVIIWCDQFDVLFGTAVLPAM